MAQKIRYLTTDDIARIHSFLIDEIGGVHGVRDQHALHAIEGLPRQSFGGKELYATIFLKAAVYVRSVIHNHPFVDGNKRTGMTAAFVFLENNGCLATAPKGLIQEFAVKIVTEKLEIEAIAAWLKKYTKKV